MRQVVGFSLSICLKVNLCLGCRDPEVRIVRKRTQVYLVMPRCRGAAEVSELPTFEVLNVSPE